MNQSPSFLEKKQKSGTDLRQRNILHPQIAKGLQEIRVASVQISGGQEQQPHQQHGLLGPVVCKCRGGLHV